MIRRLRHVLFLPMLALMAAACGGANTATAGPSTSVASTSLASSSTVAVAPSSTAAPSTSITASTTVATSTTSPATTDPPAVTSAPPSPDLQIPTLLITDGSTVRRVGPDSSGTIVSSVVLVTESPARVAFAASDLTIFTEEDAGPSGGGVVAHYLADGTRELVPNAQSLYGIVAIGGEESLIVAQEHSVTMDSGDLVAVGVETGTIVTLGPAWGPEYAVGTVEWSHTGVAVVSALSDLTESVTYIDSAGRYVTRPSPTDGLAYASAPLVQAAALSPDGGTVVWAEGPDSSYDNASGQSVLVGDTWLVKGMNLDTGAVEFAMPIDFTGIDPRDSAITSIHWARTHLVVNRTQVVGSGIANLPPVLIDMTGAEPAVVPFTPTGTATPYPPAS